MADKEMLNEENVEIKGQDMTEENKESTMQEENLSEGNQGEGSTEKLSAEVADLKEKYLRLYSEFENYRRRTAKERLDLIKTASEDLMKEIIPVVDDFERAFRASEKEESGALVREGNQLVFHKLVKTLENQGLKAMDDLIGKPFDADTQEAITQIPAPTEDLKGKVVDIIEKGYTLGDKVVRYAKVVIGA